MKEFLLLLVVLIILGLFACSKKAKPAKETSLSPEEKAIAFANKTYQKAYQVDFNPSKTVACISKSTKTKAGDTHPTLSFTLYQPSTEKILFKETIRRATGKWKNDNQFEVTIVPARVGRMGTLDKKQGWIYDLTTMKKIKK